MSNFSLARRVLLFAPLLLSADGGRGLRISAPLPRAVLGDVLETRYSADGQWLVYRADRDQDEVFELFSVRADGSSASVRLDTVAVLGGDVLSFALDASGARVVYRADQEADGVFELFVVPLDGSSAPLKLNGALVAGGDVEEYALSADGTRVVYRSDTFSNNRFNLLSVPLDRSLAPVVINTPLGGGGSDVEEFALTPDGQRAVFHLDQFSFDEIGVAPIDGSAPGTVLWAGNAGIPQRFQVEPTSQRVVYLFASSGAVELYSLQLAGGESPRRLSQPLLSGRAVSEFQLSSDGRSALYRADVDARQAYELFSVALDASAPPLQLNQNLPAGHFVGPGIALTPDDTHAVYRTEFLSGLTWVYDLWVVPVDASAAPLRSSGPPSTRGGPSGFRIAADGLWLAYEHADTSRSLFSTRLDASVGPLPFVTNVGCIDYRISPDGATLVYTGTNCGFSPSSSELFARPIDGSAPAVELGGASGAIAAGAFEIAPGGEALAFIEDADVRGESELFTRALSGVGPLRQLSDPLPLNAFTSAVTRFRTDTDYALYAEGQRLVSVPTRGGAAVELTRALFTQSAGSFELAAGGRVVFLELGTQGPRLFSAPLDGSAPALQLDGSFVNFGMTSNFKLSADGTQIAFGADKDTLGRPEVYRVPVDGSASPQKINGPLASGGFVYDYEISVDGARVAYRADQLVQGQFEFFCGDGVNPAVRLNPLLSASADVGTLFRFSPDGTRVVFSMPTVALATAALYSTPADGSSAAVQLTDRLSSPPALPFLITADSSAVVFVTRLGLLRAPIAGGSALTLASFSGSSQVPDFQLSPSGTHVVYVADQAVEGRFELHRVPLDGSTASQVLSGVPTPSGDVLDFQITPDQSRVVYRALLSPFVGELFVVPFDGSTSPLRLNPSLGSPSAVSTFRLTPDGALAVYRAARSDVVFELYAVPVAGGKPAVRLSASPAINGDVQVDFALTPDGQLALFRLDTQATGAFQLFASPLTRQARPSGTPSEFVERPR